LDQNGQDESVTHIELKITEYTKYPMGAHYKMYANALLPMKIHEKTVFIKAHRKDLKYTTIFSVKPSAT
jgi:hypothetical protein